MRKSPGLVGGDKILFSESELLLCKAVVSCVTGGSLLFNQLGVVGVCKEDRFYYYTSR